MESGMESAVRPSTETRSISRSRSWGRPCSRACMRSATDSDAQSGTEADARSSARRNRCPLGFSEMQIAILSVLKAHSQVIAYWQIAESVTSGYGLAATEGVVRGALERLFPRGFLVRRRAARGRAQGNRYAFASEPCPHILPYCLNTESGMEPNMESVTQSDETANPSILQEKIERENLSISSGESEKLNAIHKLEALTEDDMAYHWPNLAGMGFGTCQIRQIIERLTQVTIGAEKVMQGLTHAEWELEAGTMRDKSGQQVANPANWVFSILAKQGYYRRPQGYVSPLEQAALDATAEAERVKLAHEAHKKSAFDAWLLELPPDERAAITMPTNGAIKMPGDTALRLHFKDHVWPKILTDRGAI